MRPLVGDLPRLPVTIARELGARPGDKHVDLTIGEDARCAKVRVGLTWCRPGLGGSRASWICPVCGTRRRWLYLPGSGRGVACRDCLMLTYRCRRDHRTKHFEDVVRPMLADRRQSARR